MPEKVGKPLLKPYRTVRKPFECGLLTHLDACVSAKNQLSGSVAATISVISPPISP